MGVYLSTPNTEKISSDETCQGFTYGASSMQGWRMAQEDAHNCLLEFDEHTALFAVYDGHGGAEVAQYCAANLPQYIKETKSYKEGKFSEALEEAFLGFDAILTTPKIVQELKVLAGVESDDEGDPAKSIKQQRTEAELLRQEADMPIEELMAKYESEDSAQPRTRILRKKTQVNSPVIKPKKLPFPQNASKQDIETNENSEVKLEDKISNGHAENENNINLEKESQMSSSLSTSTSSSLSSSVQQDVVSSSADNSSKSTNSSEDPSQSCSSSSQKEEATSSTVDGSSHKGLTRSKKTLKDLESSGVSSSDSTQTKETSSTGTKVNDSEISDGPSSSNTTEAACGSSTVTGGSDMADPVCGSSSHSSGGSAGSSIAGSVGGSGSSSGSFFIGEPAAGGSSSNKNESAGSSSGINDDEEEDDDEEMEDYEDEDLSGSDDDEEFEAASDEDEDEESDDDEEIEEEEEDSYMAERTPTEEPGSDSGSTAVLAMIKNKKLYVANAGDSRCILSRGGKAIDMSVDHKPEDECEKNRIEAAGGKVTEEGRVNGGLNLSRAIGDHFYKRNMEKSPREQMITALPDIETAVLQENDEFLVLACDGIWNYMTSQEVVDFVKEKMKEEENRKQLSLICEKLFDKCLAPNTLGDGTGCDNMTCIIVTFDQLWNNNKNKRPAEDNEEMSDKRRKTEELGT